MNPMPYKGYMSISSKQGVILETLPGVVDGIMNLETINIGVMMLDKTGKVIKNNSALEKVIGIEVSTFLGYHIKDIPGLNKIASVVEHEMLDKLRCAPFVEQLNGKKLLILGNCFFDSACEITNLVLSFQDLNHLNTLAAQLQPAKQKVTPVANQMQFILDNEHSVPVVEGMVAASDALIKLVNTVIRVARVDSTVLILGETGVGKEVMARIIHKNSDRSDKPFIKLNCGAIPENLIESEIFGYEPGSFTGADKNGKPGLIEMANGGTLFLDEIGELPINIQVKFLRVLQEKEIQRIGGVKPKKVDFRLIVATNRNLAEMVDQKEFRSDLFYRINVVPIYIPPLRERKEDIFPLLLLNLTKFNNKYGLDKRFSHEVIRSLVEYNWPGNVRELENTVERLVVTSDCNIITSKELTGNTKVVDVGEEPDIVLRGYLENTEKQVIIGALQRYKTTRQMANALGISQSAIVKKMKKYGISKASII